MKIHEYQARQLLQEAGIPVPPCHVVGSVEDAVRAYDSLGGRVVVKAQVFAGGRGKAGFVRLCDSREQVREAAEYMLTHRMVSRQTGPEGVEVKRLLLTPAVEIAQEYYVGVVVDRARGCPVVMVSREGGVEIEEVAARDPEAIVKAWMHPHLGLGRFQAAYLARRLGLPEETQRRAAEELIGRLAEMFVRLDASLVEINPLVLTAGGEVVAIDAKMNFDDNALMRHPEIASMFDPSEENPRELEAKQHNLSYIALEGNIGCLVNGAGLAMATMDLIKLHGGEPANFLDVGGSVTPEAAVQAFRILLADERVRGVLVNIFGGIVNCETIAGALIAAAREVGFHVPVVVRLEGTNVDRAREMLSEAHIPGLITAADLTDAARRVCAEVGGG